MAEKANIHLHVDTMLESRLVMTAFCSLLLCSPVIKYYDFDTAHMFSKNPATDGIVHKKNGVVKVTEVFGLYYQKNYANFKAITEKYFKSSTDYFTTNSSLG